MCKSTFVLLTLLQGVFSVSSMAQDSTIQTVAAIRQELITERFFDGVVEPVNTATVSAQTSGQVIEVNYDVNDFVEKDSVIIRIREIQQSAQVAQAEAAVREANALLLDAQKRLKRAEDLQASKNISKSDYDSARAAFDASKARAASAKAALTQAQESLGYTVVRAPFDGIVTARHVEVGETVSAGQPLMTGFSLSQLRIRVDVPQRLIAPIRKLKTARVLMPDNGNSLATDSLTIFPFANAQSSSFTVRMNLPPETNNLFPGMLTKVAFVTGKEPGLVIPESAIVYRSEVTGVYVVDTAGVIQLRQLRLGRPTDSGLVEVLAGLKEGEQVAVNPIAAGVSGYRAESSVQPVPD